MPKPAAQIALIIAMAAAPARAQWTRFGGPNQDFTCEGISLAEKWPVAGPRRIWSRPLGEGYSSILVDGGTLVNGLPYLVMELVHGAPIDRWCDEHALTVRERVALDRACDAIELPAQVVEDLRALEHHGRPLADRAEQEVERFRQSARHDPQG